MGPDLGCVIIGTSEQEIPVDSCKRKVELLKEFKYSKELKKSTKFFQNILFQKRRYFYIQKNPTLISIFLTGLQEKGTTAGKIRETNNIKAFWLFQQPVQNNIKDLVRMISMEKKMQQSTHEVFFTS